AARARADAEHCSAVAARVEALEDLPWRSFASALFRDRAAQHAGQIRVIAREYEQLSVRAGCLAAIVARAERAP
ncbi:MAG: hypothetical protein ABI131_02580, partial [Nostocoides sp.]